ncbi:uncharacterized protein ACIBXB_008306 [Morphnus guianensis]
MPQGGWSWASGAGPGPGHGDATALLVSVGEEDKSCSGGTEGQVPVALLPARRWLGQSGPQKSCASMCSHRSGGGARTSMPAQHDGLALSHLPIQGLSSPALSASRRPVSARLQKADWHSACEIEIIFSSQGRDRHVSRAGTTLLCVGSSFSVAGSKKATMAGRELQAGRMNTRPYNYILRNQRPKIQTHG